MFTCIAHIEAVQLNGERVLIERFLGVYTCYLLFYYRCEKCEYPSTHARSVNELNFHESACMVIDKLRCLKCNAIIRWHLAETMPMDELLGVQFLD